MKPMVIAGLTEPGTAVITVIARQIPPQPDQLLR